MIGECRIKYVVEGIPVLRGIFAVFDGHSGACSASLAAAKFVGHLQTTYLEAGSEAKQDFGRIMQDALVALEKEILQESLRCVEFDWWTSRCWV